MSEKVGKCKYEGCKRKALPNSKYCICHEKRDDKDIEAFNREIEKIMQDKEAEFYDFRGFYFPESFDFEVIYRHLKDRTFEKSVNFEKAIFYSVVDFKGAIFQKKADFNFAIFKRRINFKGANFEGETHFDGATFEGIAYFTGAEFQLAYFKGAIFSKKVEFINAKFKRVNFENAFFQKEADFEVAIFKDEAFFTSAEFQERVNFKQVRFYTEGNFGNTTFKGLTYFRDAIFEKGVIFRNAKFKEMSDFKYTIFKEWIDFVRVVFEKKADFSFSEFKKGSDFRYSRFEEKADFWDVEFQEADFGYTTLRQADFRYTRFRKEANFGHARFQGVEFDYAVFEKRADFLNSSVTKIISFYNTGFHDTFSFIDVKGKKHRLDFMDTEFSDRTRIGGGTNLERALFSGSTAELVDFTDAKFPEKIYEERLLEKKFHGQLEKDEEEYCPENWQEVSTVYRKLKQAHQRHGDYIKAGEFFYREMECKKKALREKRFSREWFRSFGYSFLKYSCGYGEKPGTVIRNSILAVFGFAFAYLFSNSINLSGNSAVRKFLQSLYFSTITFTTLGYGDIHPINDAGRVLAMSEAVLGAIFVALFIFVFSRKMMR